ncbi:unnamed protein product [Prunus brigantina]
MVSWRSEKIRKLINIGGEADLMTPKGRLLTNKVVIKFNVASTSMEYRVCRHISCAEIVQCMGTGKAVEHPVHVTKNKAKKIRHKHKRVLRFRTGARNCWLLFGAPGNKIRA